MWNVLDKGFLSLNDPTNTLSIIDIKNTELIYAWENLSSILPHYLKEECLREEIIYTLRTTSHNYYHGFIDSLGAINYERAFLLLAYFSNAYINSYEGKQKTKLPKELAIPFTRVAHLVGRHPVLDYTSYILYNWQRKNINKDIVENNINILHTFTESSSEQAIISTFVEMEAKGAQIIKQLANPHLVADSLIKINELFKKIKIDVVDDFLEKILSDYKNLRYEQWKQDSFTFPCDVFLQSPLLHTLYKYLDINFQNDYLRKRNEDIRHFHMPASHRTFIYTTNGIRNKCNKDKSSKEVYNNCLTQLIELRNNLIFRKVDKDIGMIASKELACYFL